MLRKLADDTKSQLAIFDSYGFPASPELEHYCARRFMEPGGAKVTMDAFSSAKTEGELTALYTKRLGTRGREQGRQDTSWRLPPEAKTPRRTLSISDPAAVGRQSSCEHRPPKTARSLLVLTRFD